MTIFTVHRKPWDPPDKIVLVSEGFSAGAFAFTVLWALAKRLWLVAAGLVLVFALVNLSAAYLGLDSRTVVVLELALGLIFGFEAREIQRWSLGLAGYSEVAAVSGACEEEAELRYFLAGPSAPGYPRTGLETPRKPELPHDTLGLFGTG